MPDRKSVIRFWPKVKLLFKMSQKETLLLKMSIQMTLYKSVVCSIGKLWDLLGLKSCAKHGHFSNRVA